MTQKLAAPRPPRQRTAVPYLRVSTDGRGQDPIRQIGIIRKWADAEGIELYPAVTDEGTSALKTDPFERPRFQEAVKRAQILGADAIAVELGDRFTRRGTRHYFVYAYRLEEDYGLKLWEADQTIAQQESRLGEILRAIKAMAANEWIEDHKLRVQEVMDRLKASGKRLGRPPKPLEAGEGDIILAMRGTGTGWGTITHAINKRRGVFDLIEPRARHRRSVSDAWVRRWHAQLTEPRQKSHPEKSLEVPA